MSRFTSDRVRLKKALVDAMGRRSERESFDSSGTLGWVLHERKVMVDTTRNLIETNGVRVDEAALVAAVEAAEINASGHIDYASKWPQGCAEYILSASKIEERTP